jgi:tetratricopeptide (TPR) repeat protein
MRSLLLLLTLAFAIPAAGQSVTRPRQLNEQLQRAQTALVSGSSLLEAKARVDRVLAQLPADSEARVLRAEILLSMGRFEAAAVDAREATRLQPASGAAHLALAEAAFKTGHLADAELAMNRASQLLVDDGAAHVRIARIARDLGRNEQSVAFARIAVALTPASSIAHYELARAFTVSANTDAAASVLASGLEGGLLSPDLIRSDSILVILLQHPALSPYLQ